MKRALPLLLLLLLSCMSAKQAALGPQPWPDNVAGNPQVGQRAPNFKLATTAGATMSLDQLHGKPVIVNFFATWCTSCRQEMPLLERASKAVTVIGVDLRDEGAAVAFFGHSNNATYPLLLDASGDVNESYRIANLPVTYAIDATGVIQTVVIGPVTEPKLRPILAQLGAPPLP